MAVKSSMESVKSNCVLLMASSAVMCPWRKQNEKTERRRCAEKGGAAGGGGGRVGGVGRIFGEKK